MAALGSSARSTRPARPQGPILTLVSSITCVLAKQTRIVTPRPFPYRSGAAPACRGRRLIAYIRVQLSISITPQFSSYVVRDRSIYQPPRLGSDR
jgi:hypothetical protein